MLFTAGILPSLLIGVIDAIYVIGYARVKGVPLGTTPIGRLYGRPARKRAGQLDRSP